MIYLETKGSNGMTDFVIELNELNLETQTLGGLRYTDQYNGHSWIEATSIASVSYDPNAGSGGHVEIWATMPDGNGYLFRFEFWNNRQDPDAISRFYFLIGSGTDPNQGGFQVYYSHWQGYNEAVPEMVEGYSPVFVVPELADAFDDGNGSHHQHVLGGKTYYMPEGLTLGTNAWHGDYPSYVAPGSGVQVDFTVSDAENAGWTGAVVYVYESDTGLVAGSFGCGPGENGTVHSMELKGNVAYVWDVKFMTYAILGEFSATRADTGDQILSEVLGGTFTNMYGSFQLVVHAEDYSLITMSASVIDSTSATISTEWTPYTLANAAGWAAASAGSFGSVGAQWTGAVFNFGSSGTINFASAGLQSVEVAAVDGSGNVLYISSAISVDTALVTITVDSQDAWGDGWNGTKLEFYGPGGGLAGEYTLVSGAGETVEMVLPAGDYTWALTTSSAWNYPNETSVTVTDAEGNVLAAWVNGTPESGSFSLASSAGSGDSGEQTSESTLVGHWSFDSDATDSSSGYNGTVTAGSFESGDGRDFISFERESTGIVSLPDSLDSIVAGDYTMSAWVRLDTLQDTDFGYFGVMTINGVGLSITLGYPSVTSNGGNTTNHFLGVGLMSVDTWHHLVLVQEGSDKKLYLDGVLLGTNPTQPSNSWGIGTDNTIAKGYSPFDGDIDDLRIYSTALDASQVSDLYNGTTGSGDIGAPGDGVDGGDSGGGFDLQAILSNPIPDHTLVTVGLDGHVDYVVQLLDWESDAAGYLFYIRKGDNTYLAMDSWAPTTPTADWATHSIVIQESPDNLTYIDFTDPSQAQGFMLAEVWQNGAAFSNSSKLTWMKYEGLFNMGGHFFQNYIAPLESPTMEGLMANADGWFYPSTETALCVHSDQPYKVHFVDGAFENLLQPQSMPYTGRNSFLMSGMGGMWVEGTAAGQNVAVSGRYSGPVFVDDALDSDTDIDKMHWGSDEYNVIHHSATVSGQDMMSFTKYGDCFVQIFEGDIIKFDYTVEIVGNEIQVTPPAGKDGTDITVRVMNPV